MVFPAITFRSIIPFSGGLEQHVLMSDILLLAVKKHAGKLKEDHNTVTTAIPLCTLTASSGKDLYFGRAHINATNTHASNSSIITVELLVNTVKKDEFNAVLTNANGGEGDFNAQYDFIFSGNVAATQTIVLDVTAIGGTTTISGDLICFEEPTGGSPFVVSEFS